MKDRGQALSVEVQKDERTKEQIARKAGYSRSAYYKHIRDPQLEYHILTKYGIVLGFDFSIQFPDMPKYAIAQDPEEMIYGKPTNMDDAYKVIDLWRDKYIRLSDRHNVVVEKLNELLDPDRLQ
jgi:hypothetical protein